MEDSAQVVSDITSAGITPSVLEFIDRDTLDCVLDYIQTDLVSKGGPILLIETNGQEKEQVHLEMEKIESICRKNNAKSISFAQTKEEKEELWKIRKSASASLLRASPTKINEDVCVPPSQLPNLVKGIKQLGEKYNIKISTFGHAGDGNLHVNVMTDRKNQAEMQRAEKAVDQLFDLTLKLNGTISGEHGIGITKLDFLGREIGESGIKLLKKIKRVFDPKGIINPGKIFN
jgi:glycolate oxidase